MKQFEQNNIESLFNTDPFMDIVANAIGALFFVLISVALAAFGARGKINTPVLQSTETESLLVECRANTVFIPQIDSLTDYADSLFWDMVKSKEGKASFSTRKADDYMETFNAKEIGNEYYTVKYYFNYRDFEIVKSIVPIADAKGETDKTIKSENSKIQTTLKKLDNKKYHIFFLVRDDSFEVFHKAREVVRSLGFQTGWEPMKTDLDLITGASGDSAFSLGKVYD